MAPIRNESGQAILEYLLMLGIALGIMVAISIGLRSSVYKLWRTLSKEIAAGCVGCEAPGLDD